jgi:2-polyprenyl-3-methyl-5-hydroxy-6-metoxy-1,4-benzoquinol methylase
MPLEKKFDKYQKRGSMHWREMISRDIRKFNAFQQARYDWIIKSAGELKAKKVLDLGSGDGALSYLLAREGAVVVGVDNDELGVEFAEANLKSVDPDNKLQYSFITGSAYQLPFPDESFDIVALCEVIEHLAEPERMLVEVKRVLKPGGKLVLTTPHRLRETPADPNHVQEFFPEELRLFLVKYFSVVEIKLTHHVFWHGLYSYSFRHFRNRHFGMWFVNLLYFLFGWNPFMIDYPKPTKFDLFAQILGIAIK